MNPTLFIVLFWLAVILFAEWVRLSIVEDRLRRAEEREDGLAEYRFPYGDLPEGPSCPGR